MTSVARTRFPFCLAFGALLLSGCDNGQIEGSCPVAGAIGCACASDLECYDEQTRCLDGTCATCPHGTAGCLCASDGWCEDRLICAGQFCAACTVGSIGCACDAAGGCTSSTAFCDAGGRCQRSGCPEGNQGCACTADGSCATGTFGEPLTCNAGLCQASSCLRGDLGCPCLDGGACHAGGECVEELCQASGCEPGTESCMCAGGGCGPGLTCENGLICVSDAGRPGGPCLDGNLCSRGSLCNSGLCLPCALGSQGCSCDAGATCNVGLACEANRCLTRVGLAISPPNPPRCYTPCTADVPLDDGSVAVCSAEGLLDGCHAGETVCRDGQCLAPGSALQPCAIEADCPAFQTCLAGTCRSNCETDDGCITGAACFKKVCRQTCMAGSGDCPDGFHCETLDGTIGTCMPLPPASPRSPTQTAGSFKVSPASLSLTNTNTIDTLRIDNLGSQTARITVRKVSSRVIHADGSVTTRRLSGRCTPGSVGCSCDAGERCVAGGSCYQGVCEAEACSPGTANCRCADPANPCGIGLSCENDTLCVKVPQSCVGGDCPLYWLEMGEGEDRQLVSEFDVIVSPGDYTQITVGGAGDGPSERWEGSFEISHESYGVETVLVSYAQRPEGHWTGSIYYFANFEEEGLEAWKQGGKPTSATDPLFLGLRNPLVQNWASFKDGRFSFDWLQAVLTAIRSESWRSEALAAICPENKVCAPFNNAVGYIPISNDARGKPVPSGVVELPIAVNIRPVAPGESVAACGDAAYCYTGRIESATAMHYAGDPAVALRFAADPSDPNACSSVGTGGCLVYIDDLTAEVLVGGRYDRGPGDCQPGFATVETPWLVPGFLDGTRAGASTGLAYKHECRNELMPFDTSGPNGDEARQVNAYMSAANPIPDGRTRTRTLEIIDGALIASRSLLVIFEERTPSLLGTTRPTQSAYGVIVLTRTTADLEPDAYDGNAPQDVISTPSQLRTVECSDDLLSKLDANLTQFSASELYAIRDGTAGASAGSYLSGWAEAMRQALIDGVVDGFDSTSLLDSSRPLAQVHYYCEDTGLFDQGPDPANPLPCPAGSNVVYFYSAALSESEIDNANCQQSGLFEISWRLDGDGDLVVEVTRRARCIDQLNAWVGQGRAARDPVWRCTNGDRVYCSDNRFDLRDGKEFFLSTEANAVYVPLHSAIDSAFRYRTRFVNRSGSGVGFVPQMCARDSDAVPYCYDPPAIQEVRDRIDCAVELYQHLIDHNVAATTQNDLQTYLTFNFGFDQQTDPSTGELLPPAYGFEHLNAELMIMLGDDSYAKALASRFDLAGVGMAAFEGSLFEPDGINLSGAAGFEMVRLYQAAQYYQAVLDRFFRLSPAFDRSLLLIKNYITLNAVVTYFDRVVRASTQKAQAYSQIATRYQNLNRPDLARLVIERAYPAAYLESAVMTHVMDTVLDVVQAQDRALIRAQIEEAARTYRVALTRMHSLYENIEDEVNYFGFAADYIPFPALESQLARDNPFEVSFNRAWTRMLIAKEAEQAALQSDRSFETDAAAFQNELARIRTTYEAQLADLCGTFRADDGNVYPAITKYSYLADATREQADICGRVGTGAIHQAMGNIDIALTNMERVRVAMQNVVEEARIEGDRITALCGCPGGDGSLDSCCNLDAHTLAALPLHSIAHVLEDVMSGQNPFDWQYILQIISPEDLNTIYTTVCADSGVLVTHAAIQTHLMGSVNNLQAMVDVGQFTLSALSRVDAVVQTVAHLSKCSIIGGVAVGGDCPMAAAAATIYLGSSVVTNAASLIVEGGIQVAQQEVRSLQALMQQDTLELQCKTAEIDSKARVESIQLRLAELRVEALRAAYEIDQVFSQLQQLRNQASRIEDEMAEMEEMAINVEAARNNPNVRIYRNDAILQADRTFYSAVREAYMATRVWEYYTSQSYPLLDQLFLVRMVTAGDINLQQYLIELEDAFRYFEDTYGLPDLRLVRLSLKDDILRIPLANNLGEPLDQQARAALFQQRLKDPKLLDSNGYLVIPFNTTLGSVSPLTRVHKIGYVEADISGSGIGDQFGRVYLRMAGTGTISAIDGDTLYYRLPERIAVINAMINSAKPWAPELYQSRRLQARPLINSRWELVFNRVDESVNTDIRLDALNDILLYVYYSDFTVY